MKVDELKEILEEFDDDSEVVIPNQNDALYGYTHATVGEYRADTDEKGNLFEENKNPFASSLATVVVFY